MMLCSLVDDRELDRLSIVAGVCETELTRQAKMELKRRGYKWSSDEQRWRKAVAPEKE